MEKQELFDTVAAALIKQGEPSFEGENCLYFTMDGKRCAIGWLIDENTPFGAIAKGSRDNIDQLISTAKYRKVEIPTDIEDQIVLIRDLQAAHDLTARAYATFGDNSTWILSWAHNMERIAQKYNLNTNILEEQEKQ